jgi:hypothetical protein
MAIYRTQYLRPISKISPEQRLSNQVVLSGTDQDFLVNNGYFFLELLELASGTVDIADGDGNAICTSGGFSNDHSPLRCDKGIQLTGTVRQAKGFYLEDILV